MRLICRNIPILLALLLSLSACGRRHSDAAITTAELTALKPDAPATQQQQVESIATHYWDSFNFADTTLISRADITEQAFVDFVNILPHLPQPLVEKGVEAMMNGASADKAMYLHFMELSEKYLYNPNSPFRNENIYIAVLRKIIGDQLLDDIYKIRPRYQLETALKNRVGSKATNFAYTTDSGGRAMLYDTLGDPLLLMFFHPDCPGCKEIKEYIANKGIDQKTAILYVNISIDTHLDAHYDLQASPTLYLLDKEKVVLLKDAPIELIEQYLNQ